ncbi:MAG: CAP domain-containing protein, partial [Hyphomicrobiaceae bacterium]|nr:CAP domain-containing protein [Hyphomicrobiaceae bacterium]
MTPDLPAVEAAIVEMTNLFRRQNRLTELRRVSALDKVARHYAYFLARTGRFAHNADGRSPGERTEAGGYRYCLVAENLALHGRSTGFQSRELAGLAVEGWKGSPGHRRNMLTRFATEIGVGVARAPRTQRYLSVQVFARPASMRFSFKIRNQTPFTLTYRYEEKQHDLPPRIVVTHTVCRPGTLTFGPVSKRGVRRG